MSVDFETYGPFVLNREKNYVFRDDVDDFWDRVEEKVQGLGEAVGVYVIVVRNKTSSSKQWCVGKTDKGFRKRLFQHAGQLKLFAWLHNAAPVGTMEIYFLPRLTKGKRFRSAAKGTVRSIDRLEELLIGTCYSKNPRLINTQKKSFLKNLRVPGYINGNVGKPSKSASSFGELLFAGKLHSN
jgi:hypothetical protein